MFTRGTNANRWSSNQCQILYTCSGRSIPFSLKCHQHIWRKFMHRVTWQVWRDGHFWFFSTSLTSVKDLSLTEGFLAVVFDVSLRFLRKLCGEGRGHWAWCGKRTSSQSPSLICCRRRTEVNKIALHIELSGRQGGRGAFCETFCSFEGFTNSFFGDNFVGEDIVGWF